MGKTHEADDINQRQHRGHRADVRPMEAVDDSAVITFVTLGVTLLRCVCVCPPH